jgi:hypothetical protein
MNIRIFCLFSVFFLQGYVTSIFAKSQNDSIKNKVQIEMVMSGKALYEKSCTHCHKLKSPSKYTIQQWPGLVNKMQKRSKITDEQKAIILTYLTTEAKK